MVQLQHRSGGRSNPFAFADAQCDCCPPGTTGRHVKRIPVSDDVRMLFLLALRRLPASLPPNVLMQIFALAAEVRHTRLAPRAPAPRIALDPAEQMFARMEIGSVHAGRFDDPGGAPP
jgi:hypothetical protein